MNFAGDSLIASPNLTTSRSIEIEAPVSAVWPWVIQIGQERGGFYSYSMLENLIGCKIKNADEIHPEWQTLKVGETISMHPNAPKLHVAMVQRERHIVFSQTKPITWTWGFYLEKTDTNNCMLTVRTRCKIDNWIGRMLAWPLVKGGHGIMERKMMKGIQSRAEKSK